MSLYIGNTAVVAAAQAVEASARQLLSAPAAQHPPRPTAASGRAHLITASSAVGGGRDAVGGGRDAVGGGRAGAAEGVAACAEAAESEAVPPPLAAAISDLKVLL